MGEKPIRVGQIIALMALTALAQPAFAQISCRAAFPGQSPSLILSTIRGTTLESLSIRTGPLVGKATLDPAAKGYTIPPGDPALYYYRIGSSLAGKDWREPGSVETKDGGLIIALPDILANGAAPRDMLAEVSVGALKQRMHLVRQPGDNEAPILFLALDTRLGDPPNNYVRVALTEDQRETWRDAVIRGDPVRVQVFDATGQMHVASIDVALPDRDVMQQRLIADVNTLRKAFADNACQ